MPLAERITRLISGCIVRIGVGMLGRAGDACLAGGGIPGPGGSGSSSLFDALLRTFKRALVALKPHLVQ